MKKILIAGALATLSSFAFANDVTSPDLLSNDVASVGYVDMDTAGVDSDGFTVAYGKQFGEYFVTGDYQKVSADDFDLDAYTIDLSVGKQFAIDEVSRFEVTAGARLTAVDTAGYDDDVTDLALGATYRRLVMDNLAVSVGVDYLDADDSVTTGIVAAEYMFTSSFGAAVEYAKSDDNDAIGLKLTYRPQ